MFCAGYNVAIVANASVGLRLLLEKAAQMRYSLNMLVFTLIVHEQYRRMNTIGPPGRPKYELTKHETEV